MSTQTPQSSASAPSAAFTPYQTFVVFLLALTQFTVVLDFMVMSPLGDIMMKTLKINTAQFGWAVSAYAFSAGISGFLTAGFADKYDRKKLLLFFYVGFALATMACALAPTSEWLLAARVVTGLFGGVIGSISMAIVADLFSLQQRGRVMGTIQMSFGASQVMGIPIGLYMGTQWGWHIPFAAIAVLAGAIALALHLKLQPVTAHLSLQRNNSPFKHLLNTLSQPKYQLGYLTTALLSIGGFMMMPFGAAFSINNLKITPHDLPLLYMLSGTAMLIVMPLMGKLSDTVSKFKIFLCATFLAIALNLTYSHFSVTPFWVVAITHMLMMSAIMSRMAPAMALTSAIPQAHDRGAYMSVNSSLQQIAGGFGGLLAAAIIVQKDHYSPLEHFDTLAYIASAIMLFTIYLVYRVSRLVEKKA